MMKNFTVRKTGTSRYYENGNWIDGVVYTIIGGGIAVEVELKPNEIKIYPKSHSEKDGSSEFEINISAKAYKFAPEKLGKFFRWAQAQDSMSSELKTYLREILTLTKREYERTYGEIF